ncbi:MAG: methyltransferase domain-containing protein, partial [Elusimicrobiota bacterium]|nr:methyltransferase domain-containing protein [Elusimicrobiota bacterium]
MTICSCRVCGGAFFEGELLRYRNMPSSAQNFPDAASLAGETGADLTVRQCSGCGLVQLDNDPVPYYKEVIRAAAVSPVLMDLKTRQFSDFIRKYSLRGKKIIEIGCGRGEFLGLLPPLGAEACGLEYSEAAVQRCVKAGLKAYRGYPDAKMTPLAEGPFDAFLLLMFLEHMPAPNSALKALSANLKDGAVGLVEVPNFGMMVRDKLFSEFIGDHLLYFSRETFLATLNLNG